RFLVCRRQLLAGPRWGGRGGKTARPDDRGNDAVAFGQGSHFHTPRLARENAAADASRRQALAQPRRVSGVRDAHVVGPVSPTQIGQLIDLPMSGQRRHTEARRMSRDHIQSTRSDRARRSEYRDVLNRGHLMNASTARGSMATGASMRSSIPPWPGRKVPLSLTPAWRFIRDSNRSPIIPAIARPSRTGRIHAGATFMGLPPTAAQG